MTARRIGIVVVHWRGMADTLECLRSLATLDPRPGEIVVVTNGPGDFDEAAAREACPGIDVVASRANTGYAGGCNLGVRALIERGIDVVMLLNNDTVVTPDALAPIIEAFVTLPDAGVVGPVVTYYDDPARTWFGGGMLHRTLGYTRHIGFGSRRLPQVTREVDFVSGSAIAVRREVLERAGGLDATYCQYFEDVDLCERARALGYRCYVVPAASVRHKVSASAGERGSNRLNRRQAYYFARNRLLFVRRHFRGVRRYVAMAAQVLVLLPYEAAKAIRGGNWQEARGRMEGVVDGLRGRGGERSFGG